MLIPLQDILNKYNLSPKGVIHVGAHWAEEHDDYIKCGIERFVYIEPCISAFEVMTKKVIIGAATGYINSYYSDLPYMTNRDKGVICFRCACGVEKGEMPMYVSHQNQGQSNSLLKPEAHLIQHPEIIFDDAEIVKVVPLDNLPIEKENYDMLVMDVQGYEGEVLKGAKETLRHINIIYTECNMGQTYTGNMEIEEMDALLAEYRFKRVETFWPSPNLTWGDAVYVRV